jgi:hypothetical protein
MSQAVVPDTGDHTGRLGDRDLRLEPVRGGDPVAATSHASSNRTTGGGELDETRRPQASLRRLPRITTSSVLDG